MYVQTPFQFTFLHVYFTRLDFQFLSLTGVVMICQPYGCIWNALSYFFFTCFNYSQRLGIKTDSTIEQMNSFTCLSIFSSPELTRARRVRLGKSFIGLFKGSCIVGICKGEVDWIWMKCCEVYYAVVYGSAQTIRVVSHIYRERTIEEVSANEEGLTSSRLLFVWNLLK